MTKKHPKSNNSPGITNNTFSNNNNRTFDSVHQSLERNDRHMRPERVGNNKQKDPEVDMRRLFEHIQELKQEIDLNIDKLDFVEAIMNITKCLTLSKRFYAEDHLFNLELLFKLANSYIQINNIEEAINNLDILIGLTNVNKNEISIPALRYKAQMLMGSACINIGDYSKVRIFNFTF